MLVLPVTPELTASFDAAAEAALVGCALNERSWALNARGSTA